MLVISLILLTPDHLALDTLAKIDFSVKHLLDCNVIAGQLTKEFDSRMP